MRALILDEQVRENVRQLVELARLNPYSLEEMTELAKGFDPQNPATRTKRVNTDFTIDIPMGYVVTYTHEHQPMGLCRHLSVSVPKAAKFPNPVAVQEIMNLFGFVCPLAKCMVWEEKYAPGFSAVNVMEAI